MILKGNLVAISYRLRVMSGTLHDFNDHTLLLLLYLHDKNKKKETY